MLCTPRSVTVMQAGVIYNEKEVTQTYQNIWHGYLVDCMIVISCKRQFLQYEMHGWRLEFEWIDGMQFLSLFCTVRRAVILDEIKKMGQRMQKRSTQFLTGNFSTHASCEFVA